MQLHITIMFSTWNTWYWCFRFARKAFLFTIFLIIKVYLWNEANLDSHNNLHSFCDCVLQSCSPHWDIRYWGFGLSRKTFLSTVFLIVKVNLRNDTKLDTCNNLYSFYYWHYNHVHLIGIHDIDALVWGEKLFFSQFSL